MKHLLYSALAIILLGISTPMTIKAGNPDSTATKKTQFTPRKNGWYTTINVEPVAVNVNQKTWAAPMSLLSVSTGYQICPYIAIGGGIGYRWRGYRVQYVDVDWAYADENRYMPTIPIFLDVCVSLNDKRVIPYFPIQLGYNIIADASRCDINYAEIQNAETTAFWSVGFGMKVRFHKASSWNLAGTLTAEQFKYDLRYLDHSGWKTRAMDPSYLLFAISTGFTF